MEVEEEWSEDDGDVIFDGGEEMGWGGGVVVGLVVVDVKMCWRVCECGLYNK